MKATKKILSVVLALLMVLSVFSCLTINVSAAGIIAKGTEEVDTEDGGTETVERWVLYSDGKLVVDEIPYDEDSGTYQIGWIIYKDMITSVTFNEQDIVPSRLFDGYPKLTSVTFNNVVEVQSYSFQNCPLLTTLKFGTLFHSVGDYAFYNCPSLKEVDLKNCLGDTSIEGAEGAYVGKNVFKNCIGLEKVTFGNGCKTINYGMFEGCEALTDVTIPDSIETIGALAFSGCKKLKSVVIPDSTTSVGDFAFENCISLESVTVGHNASDIGNYAFSDCSLLKSIKIKSAVTYISEGCFKDCVSLEEIVLPVSVTEIKDNAFNGCTSLKKITLDDSLQKIGKSAFYKTNLTEISIPASVTDIADGAFVSCNALKAINVAEMNQDYKSVDGVLYNKTLTKLISCPAGKDGNVKVPSSVTEIGENAFVGCKNILAVEIDENVTTIPENAFNGANSALVIKTACNTEAAKFVAKMGMDKSGITHIGSENWVVVTEASCLSDGEKVLKCTGCDEILNTKVIKTTDHNFVEDTEAYVAPQCGIKGSRTYRCANEGCDEFYTEEIEALEHKYVGVITKEANCTSEREITYTCELCGDTYKSYEQGAHHYHTTYSVDKAPTTTETGLQSHHCAICGQSDGDYVEIPVISVTLDAPVIYNNEYFAAKGKNIVDYIVKDGIAVKWAAVEDAEGYYVYRSANGGSFTKVATVSGTAYTDKNVKSGVKYSYKIAAYNGNVKSAYSDVLTLTYLATPTVTIKAASSGVSASWNKIAGASYYRIYRKAANETAWKVVGDKVKTTSYTDKTAKSGVKYSYTVRAYIGSSFRGYFKATEETLFLATPKVTATPLTTSVKLTWGKVAGAKNYYVYRKNVNTGKWVRIATLSSSKLTYTDKGLKKGTNYIYTVKAVNGKVMSSNVSKTVTTKK